MSINSVSISGNLTRSPELRTTQAGKSILNFGVAVNERRKNPQSGQWEDYANFVDCVMFGNRAEALAGMLHKGTKVCVSGSLRYSSWERDGQKRSKLEVVAQEIDIMSQRQHDQQGAGYQQQGQQGGGYQQQGQSGYPQGGYEHGNAQAVARGGFDTYGPDSYDYDGYYG